VTFGRKLSNTDTMIAPSVRVQNPFLTQLLRAPSRRD